MNLSWFKKILKVAGLFYLARQGTHANQVVEPHTWHNITAEDGDWSGKLAITSEDAFFTNASGNIQGEVYDFNVSPSSSPLTYGFFFIDANFDVSYVLTLYKDKDSISKAKSFTPQFVSEACQFAISAKGPADPDIRVEKYNGASCEYTINPGVGENFKVGSKNSRPQSVM